MKILHVLDHSLPVADGYSFRTDSILRAQRALGWDTVQVTSSKQGTDRASTEPADDIEFLRTPAAHAALRRLPAGDPLAVVLELRNRLGQVIAKERPDLIHAHSPCLTALAALGMGPPLVYELRSSWEDAAVSSGTTTEGSLRYRASHWLETLVLRRADAVTTICSGLRDDVIRRRVPPDRVTVVPNAIDFAALETVGSSDVAQIRRKYGFERNLVLGFIGSFFAWEGLVLLVEALGDVIAHEPDVRLLLVGGGEQDGDLRHLVGRLGLTGHVVFAGRVPHMEAVALYEAVDILVYPRLPMRLTNMVTPLKPLEAMALGKLVVASDVGGHRELVKPGETGVLFKAGNKQALARAVVDLIRDPVLQQRLRQQGPLFVRGERSWSRVVPIYEPVYRRLLSRARDGRRGMKHQ